MWLFKEKSKLNKSKTKYRLIAFGALERLSHFRYNKKWWLKFNEDVAYETCGPRELACGGCDLVDYLSIVAIEV